MSPPRRPDAPPCWTSCAAPQSRSSSRSPSVAGALGRRRRRPVAGRSRQGVGQHRGDRPAGAARRVVAAVRIPVHRPNRSMPAPSVRRRPDAVRLGVRSPRTAAGGAPGSMPPNGQGGEPNSVGEILLNSMDADGTKGRLRTWQCCGRCGEAVTVPVIASGARGGGRPPGGAGRCRRGAGRQRVPLRRTDHRSVKAAAARGDYGPMSTARTTRTGPVIDPAIAAGSPKYRRTVRRRRRPGTRHRSGP